MNAEPFKKKKSLGQNFLKNLAVVHAMVRAGDVRRGHMVLEIGPGKGILTRALLETGARVIAVEKDDRLISILGETFAREVASGQLTIVYEDILNIDIKNILGSSAPKYKLVANIPYYITGQLFRLFLESEQQPSCMVVLVQKEVAQRIVAHDGKESILSMSVKAYGTPKIIQKVSRKLFSPEPNVDSAVLRISDISKNFFKEFSEKTFFAWLRAGFAHKRKLLIRNLEVVATKEKLGNTLRALNINAQARAENMDLSDWQNILKQSL